MSKKIPVPIPVELLAVSTTNTRGGTIRPAPVAAVLIAVPTDCYCHRGFVAGRLEGELPSGCGGKDSLRVR